MRPILSEHLVRLFRKSLIAQREFRPRPQFSPGLLRAIPLAGDLGGFRGRVSATGARRDAADEIFSGYQGTSQLDECLAALLKSILTILLSTSL
jgi:hypothetical protein